jgi:hypothetical protein
LSDWTREIALLHSAGVVLEPGLAEPELAAAERTCEAPFPSDLRELLAVALPSGRGFPDWREPESEMIQRALAWPFEGIAFDIEHSDFWWGSWGKRPPALVDAVAVARRQVTAAPRLIPIYMHRYLPALPATAGNPVLSVYQTDVIYYASDLRAYIAREFGSGGNDISATAAPRSVPFWSDLIAAAG